MSAWDSVLVSVAVAVRGWDGRPFCHGGPIQTCLVFKPEGTLIEKLPAEIFLRIVQLGSQDDDYDPGEYAILASHICSHWRNLVVGCPSLWTDVYITNIPLGRLNLECASAFLARSGQLPLGVTIEAAPGYLGGKWVNVTGAIAGLVAPHVHRVREFQLMYTELSRIEDVMGMIPRSPAPILEGLSFQCTPASPAVEGVSGPRFSCLAFSDPPARGSTRAKNRWRCSWPPRPQLFYQLDREDCDAALRAFFAHLHQLRHLTLAHPDAYTAGYAASVVPVARRLELVTVRFPESVWARLGAVGFAMFMEMVADEVRFEGMDDECPTRESLDEY
ncbi:hypothetical protein BD779DRAFT_1477825 [Infundibulicybe gibba]|nr:hypothetical protein BD779DRAFT_1477825 [Infundibulicybe gibba]